MRKGSIPHISLNLRCNPSTSVKANKGAPFGRRAPNLAAKSPLRVKTNTAEFSNLMASIAAERSILALGRNSFKFSVNPG